MNSLWNDTDAANFIGDLAQCVYVSRLLGSDGSLVLHGGGNTSVKVREKNIFGDEEDILYVKGRGANLTTIDQAGFSPCRLEHLQRVARLQALSDEQMENELKCSLTCASAPVPSVETLLHAILPAKFVDHTHADALMAIMNTPRGLERIQQLYGDQVVIVPYAMPGFRLVRLCQEIFPRRATHQTIGMVLMHHGVFAFGDTAREAYERMIALVDQAEQYLVSSNAWTIEWPRSQTSGVSSQVLAHLRRKISDAAGAPMIMSTHTDPQALSFAHHPNIERISQQGVVTPDHVIRTKRIPMLGRDVTAYTAAYRNYVDFNSKGRKVPSVDPAPRVVLDPELGMCIAGRSVQDVTIAEDIYRHTIDTIVRAERLGGYRALPPNDFFDVEYWDMERTKLTTPAADKVFLGEVALVTGAASGIGKTCVDSLLARGAAVVGLDLAESVTQLHDRKDYLGIQCDLTDEEQIDGALDYLVQKFGGLDMLILNAGIFPKSTPVAATTTDSWLKTMSINLDSNLVLMRECHPLLKLSYRGGRVVIIGSKNVPAPGPGAGAYSASKAALQQLARVAALEWGADRIRINTLHPNAVFDTGIWTPEVLAARAASYKLTVDEYKTNNVLKVEVTSRDVAELAAEMCGPRFAKTTAAQVPVDGGNERVI